jgi:hypothetical protein
MRTSDYGSNKWEEVFQLIDSNMQAGPPRGWRGPGTKCFLGAPISNVFPEKFFSDNNLPPVDNFLGKTFFRTLYMLSSDFIIPNFGI